MNPLARVLCVWRRNFDVYLVTWKVNFLPPLLEPIFYLLAFGAGLSGYIGKLPYAGREVGYTAFIAPGMISMSMMFQSFFECTYGSYIRMYYQKTFDAIIATPLSIEDVIAGELLWGATKAFISAAIMCVIIRCFGLMSFPHLLAIPFVAFLGGLFFASIAMCFTSITPGIDAFNYPIFLLITPMTLFSGTFFPLDGLPGWAAWIARCLPLSHFVHSIRALSFGRFDAGVALRLAIFAVVTAPLMALAIRLMRRRLVV